MGKMVHCGLTTSTATKQTSKTMSNYYLQTISNKVVFVMKCAGIDRVLGERDELLEEDDEDKALVPIKQSNGKDGTLRLNNKHSNQTNLKDNVKLLSSNDL
jgi:hypothetical protein